jgi:ubiquitin carboxyl-terminal hydrolase 1
MYLEAINDGDDMTPVTAALAELLRLLNTPHSFSTALHPDQVARALMQCDKSRLLATREQQDAQEFFCLLIDTLESESSRQWLLVNKAPGLEAITTIPPNNQTPPISECTFSLKTMSTLDTHISSPFEGLSANRMGCLKCKYVENIRHEKFGPIVLPLNMQRSTTLEECLREEFEMEVLEDVECQKCTLLAYRSGLSRVIKALSSSPNASPEVVTALTDATRRLEAIDQALVSGKVEDPKLLAPAGGEKEIRKFVRRSQKTKHHMIARPPQLLAFHIQRSNFHNYTGRAMKNQAPVAFPITLDMSNYVTTSTLSMDPEKPISEWKAGDERTVYRLRSVIVHYGLHHMGHYVAYRYADGGWFRISDEDVEYYPILKLLIL